MKREAFGWKTSGAFLLSTVSRQASVTPRSFISDILTIQLPEGNDIK